MSREHASKGGGRLARGPRHGDVNCGWGARFATLLLPGPRNVRLLGFLIRWTSWINKGSGYDVFSTCMTIQDGRVPRAHVDATWQVWPRPDSLQQLWTNYGALS